LIVKGGDALRLGLVLRPIRLCSVSPKMSPLCLAITLAYMNRFRKCLAQLVLRKCAITGHFIFPPYLTSAFALPAETGNPEIVFSLKCCMFFNQKTRNTCHLCQRPDRRQPRSCPRAGRPSSFWWTCCAIAT